MGKNTKTDIINIASRREECKKKFLTKNNLQTTKNEKLKADASYRRYERIKISNGSYILMDAPPEKENVKPFIEISAYLRSHGLSAPLIIDQDIDNGFLLVEDFGDDSFSKILSGNSSISNDFGERKLYERAIDSLIHLQKSPLKKDLPDYLESGLLLQETKVFIEWFVEVLNAEKLGDSKKKEYQEIWRELLSKTEIFPKVVVLKDYHADNLMWLSEEFGIKKVGILDFQDAVIGSPIYDIVSILEDARRDVGFDISQDMITRYLNAFPSFNRKDFLAVYNILGAQRNLRIIGFAARQAVMFKNPSYLSFLPRVWKYVHNNLKNPLLLPLKQWLDEVVPMQVRDTHDSKYQMQQEDFVG